MSQVKEIRANGSLRIKTMNSEPTMTQEQFKDTVNINKIMEKYHKTGMINHLRRNEGVYADLTKIKDYRSALETVQSADAAFMNLPSSVRSRFANDPQQLIEFVSDKKNRDEAIELGLIPKPPTPPFSPSPSPTPAPKADPPK